MGSIVFERGALMNGFRGWAKPLPSFHEGFGDLSKTNTSPIRESSNIPIQPAVYEQALRPSLLPTQPLPDLDITSRRPSPPHIFPLYTPFNINPLHASYPNTPLLDPSIQNQQVQTLSPLPIGLYANPNPNPNPNLTPTPSIPLLDFTYHLPRSFSFSHPTHKENARPRSEKDIRHCNAEKARRDHQSIYLDLGFSMTEEFRWPEDIWPSESSASTTKTSNLNSSTSTPTVSSNSSFSAAPTQPQPLIQVPRNKRHLSNIHEALTVDRMSNGVSNEKAEKARSKKKKDRLTKQDKLQEDRFWQFRACLRIDRVRVS